LSQSASKPSNVLAATNVELYVHFGAKNVDNINSKITVHLNLDLPFAVTWVRLEFEML